MSRFAAIASVLPARAALDYLVERQHYLAGQVAMLGPGKHEESFEQRVHPVEFGAKPGGQRYRLRWRRARLGQRDVE